METGINQKIADVEKWACCDWPSRAVRAEDLVKKLRSMSTVEMMCENYNVKCHVEEWEARCLKAEKENAEMRDKIAKFIYDETHGENGQ